MCSERRHRLKLQVVEGYKDKRPFVCTWCGSKFKSRADLSLHHELDPRCRANKNVSSPLQARYGIVGQVQVQPGEEAIRKVRGPSCEHPDEYRQALHPPNGEGGWDESVEIGWRCGHCYLETYYVTQ